MSLDTIIKEAERLTLQQPPVATSKPARRHCDAKQAFDRIKRFAGTRKPMDGIAANADEIWATDGDRVAVIPNQCELPEGIYRGQFPGNSVSHVQKALIGAGANDSSRSSWIFRASHLRSAAKCAGGSKGGQVVFSPLPGADAKRVMTARGYSGKQSIGPFFWSNPSGQTPSGPLKDEQSVSIQAKYLIDALMGLSSQSVIVEVGNTEQCRVVTIRRHDDETHFILLYMPPKR